MPPPDRPRKAGFFMPIFRPPVCMEFPQACRKAREKYDNPTEGFQWLTM